MERKKNAVNMATFGDESKREKKKLRSKEK